MFRKIVLCKALFLSFRYNKQTQRCCHVTYSSQLRVFQKSTSQSFRVAVKSFKNSYTIGRLYYTVPHLLLTPVNLSSEIPPVPNLSKTKLLCLISAKTCRNAKITFLQEHSVSVMECSIYSRFRKIL